MAHCSILCNHFSLQFVTKHAIIDNVMKVVNKKGPTVTKNFRFPAWLAKEIARLAEANGISENAIVSAILQKAVKDPKFSVEV